MNSLGLILGVVEKYLELCFLAHNLEAAALVPLSHPASSTFVRGHILDSRYLRKADGQKLEGA